MKLTTEKQEDLRNLKERLNTIVFSLRKNAQPPKFSEIIRFSKNDIYVEGGQKLHRRVIILSSTGCSLPTCTMCPFPNFSLKRPQADIINALEQIGEYLYQAPPNETQILSIYNDGSFFSDQEISQELREKIAQLISQTKIEYFMVESLPQFINEKKVEKVISLLDKTQLIVAIGLKSANKFIREYCINSSFTLKQFENAVNIIRSAGAKIKTYAMLKPPFLNETEAFIDVQKTALYLKSIGLKSMTICPTRIAPNTLAYLLYKKRLFSPPSLWTVIAALREIRKYIDCRVAMANLLGGDFDSAMADTGSIFSSEEIIQSLISFDNSGDLNDLILSDSCEKEYQFHLLELKKGSKRDIYKVVNTCLDMIGN